MKIVNLTPHALRIIGLDGEEIAVEPSGLVARQAVEYRPAGDVAGRIPVTEAVYGEVTNLPEPQDGVIYVVSGLVEANVAREDVFAPGELVRDDAGRVIGCKGLKRTRA